MSRREHESEPTAPAPSEPPAGVMTRGELPPTDKSTPDKGAPPPAESVELTAGRGTKVRAPAHLEKTLKSQGFK